jgi:beta-phosphoglucomutase family hydrolase
MADFPPTGPAPTDSFAAVLFDLDGVLTPTADTHTRAWTTMFDEFLVPRGLAPFTEDDYLRYVDGRPRFDGVRTFLASRGVTLPEGDVGDPPGDASVAALGNRKNELFLQILRDDGIAPYPGSVRFLDHLAARGTKMAVVSSSRNAREVLEASGLAPRFDVVTDGVVAATEHIAGKPEPDMFLNAAARLAVEPAEAVVVEDAVSGVAAGRAGAFGLVVGVDRGAGVEALREHGADIVVHDLAELLGGAGQGEVP